LEKMQVTIKDANYKDRVILLVEFPAKIIVDLEQQIANQTQGEADYILTRTNRKSELK
jgi:hypothetical protein